MIKFYILKRNILLWAAAGLGLYWLIGRGSLAKRTKLLLKKITYSGGLRNPKLNLQFGVQNPTNQTGTISAVTGEVYVGSELIADFSSFGEIKIQPKSETTLFITASPSVGILSLLTQKNWLKKGTKYTIRGTANVDGLIVPIDFTRSLF